MRVALLTCSGERHSTPSLTELVAVASPPFDKASTMARTLPARAARNKSSPAFAAASAAAAAAAAAVVVSPGAVGVGAGGGGALLACPGGGAGPK